MLYAYETVVPEGVEWYGRIDLRGVEPAARAEVEGQLRSVLGYGLHGVGKTKAVFALGVRDGGTVVDWAASDLRPFEVGGNGHRASFFRRRRTPDDAACRAASVLEPSAAPICS